MSLQCLVLFDTLRWALSNYSWVMEEISRLLQRPLDRVCDKNAPSISLFLCHPFLPFFSFQPLCLPRLFSLFSFLLSRNGHALHRFPRVSFMRARRFLNVILHRFSFLHIFLNLIGSELFGLIFRSSRSRRSRLSIALEIAEFPLSRPRSDCGSSKRIVVAFLSYSTCRMHGF